MKIVKKHEYVLTGKTISEDMNGFIHDARNGKYRFDHRHGMEGLKIIKQYLRLIGKEFDAKNYSVCRDCYKKMLLFLFETSSGEENYFDYEDILGRTRMDFEKITGNYIYSAIKTLPVKSFFSEYREFVEAMSEYGFESINKTILAEMDEQSLLELESMVLNNLKEKELGEDEYWRLELVYLLLDIYKKLGLKQKFADTCKTFAYVSDEFTELVEEYDKPGLIGSI